MAEEKELLPSPERPKYISKSDNFEQDKCNEAMLSTKRLMQRHFTKAS